MFTSRVLPAAVVAAFLAACSSTVPTPTAEAPKWRARSEAKLAKMERGTPDDPDARDRWYWEQRAYPAGYIPVDVHRNAIRAEIAQRRLVAENDASWSSLGPAPLLDITYGLDSAQNASGRALTLAIHPNDANTLFLGTAQGGIWKSTDRGAHWRSIGELALPTLAINVIKFKPDDPNVLYAGTGEPNGSTSIHGYGLLRSSDGGETWEALPSHGNGWNFEYSAITGVVFDARNANTMYVTTATVVTPSAFFRTPPDQPATGIFKSTDGGQSWQLLRAATRFTVSNALSSSAGFLDLEYGGANAPDLLYVSEYMGGLLKSTNGGASWDYITPRKSLGFGALPAQVANLSYYDGPKGYKYLSRFPNADNAPDFRRIEIGMSQANPQILYAGVESTTNRLDYDENGSYDPVRDRSFGTGLLFKSIDGGATWRWLGTFKDGIPNYCTAQCTYDNVITVNPDNPDDVMIGGSANYTILMPDPVDNPKRFVELPWRGMIYRSLNGGTSWLDTTPHCKSLPSQPSRTEFGMPIYTCAEVDPTKVVHPDIHGIVYGPNDSIYVLNDGGLYRTTTPRPNAGAPASGKRRAASMRPWGPLEGLSYTWENLNNDLSTLQFYRVASHPTDPNIVLGGMQDNSCGYWNGTRWEGWGAGDGTIAIFDPINPNYVYLGSQFSVHRHDNGGVKDFGNDSGWHYEVFGPSTIDPAETTAFVPVFALDPVEPHVTYGASNRGLYRSAVRGEGARRLLPGQFTDGTPTSISVSPVDHRVIWVGTNTGVVYRYFLDGPSETWKRVDIGLPDRTVSRVVASFDSADTVYAVFNGYDANTPGQPGKVFVSTNAGVTWKNISAGLPDVPATALALHPTDKNRMWVSTDAAVYGTVDGGTSWTSERRNMPVVAVQDIHYNANTGYLVVATHGRGVWRMAVGTNATATER
jgi:photosystem II stability/assembly factor-like uncharacterized protein